MYFTTMITEGVSYRFGNHWRTSAAPVSRVLVWLAGCGWSGYAGMHAASKLSWAVLAGVAAVLCCRHEPHSPTCSQRLPSTRLPPPAATVAKSAGATTQGGKVWPPGQPADVRSGRLVFNTNVHGAPFNSAAGKATLAKFLDNLRANPAAVFPPRTFGRMVLNGGSGLRLVNDPAFPCTCDSALYGCGLLWGREGREGG